MSINRRTFLGWAGVSGAVISLFDRRRTNAGAIAAHWTRFAIG